MAWRLAEALKVLRREIDDAAPDRSRVSDGTIGDAAHASRPTSDHNPYIKDANGVGVVRALDVTHDPAGGMDAHALAERIRRLGALGDPRVRYVISNARIASSKQNWAWRTYSGPNPHRQHAHISVVEDPRGYDSPDEWGITPQEDDMIRQGATGTHVAEMQELVNAFLRATGSAAGDPLLIKVDGSYGTATTEAVQHVIWRLQEHEFHQLGPGMPLGRHARPTAVSASLQALMAAVVAERELLA